MSTMTKNELRNTLKHIQMEKTQIENDDTLGISYQPQPSVSVLIKTMLEIIKIKKSSSMDEETRRQFPMIAKEIILLAEQTQ